VLQTISFSGDAELAGALQFLFRNLRWEYEEDLSRVVGDVAAHRIASTGRAFTAWQKDAAERLGQNFAEYLTEEANVLAPPAAVSGFARAVDDLRDAVERLEKRIERLEQPKGRGAAG
jgi:ubiquinone biosynthesis protein UbiJ